MEILEDKFHWIDKRLPNNCTATTPAGSLLMFNTFSVFQTIYKFTKKMWLLPLAPPTFFSLLFVFLKISALNYFYFDFSCVHLLALFALWSKDRRRDLKWTVFICQWFQTDILKQTRFTCPVWTKVQERRSPHGSSYPRQTKHTWRGYFTIFIQPLPTHRWVNMWFPLT